MMMVVVGGSSVHLQERNEIVFDHKKGEEKKINVGRRRRLTIEEIMYSTAKISLESSTNPTVNF